MPTPRRHRLGRHRGVSALVSTRRAALTGMLSAALLVGGAVAVTSMGGGGASGTDLSLLAGATTDVATAQPLDGSTLTRNSFVFVANRANRSHERSQDGIREIRWLLDGTQVAVDRHAPWTLPGLSADKNAPFDVGSVIDGRHQLTAQVVLRDGRTLELSSAFATQSPSASASASPSARGAANVFATPTASAKATMKAVAKATQKAIAKSKPAAKKTATKKPAAKKPAPKPTKKAAPKPAVAAGGKFNPLSLDYRSLGKSCVRSGNTIKGCTLAPASGAAVGGKAAKHVSYSNITSNKDGFNLTGTGYSVVEYNWIHRTGRYKNEHHDGIQFWQGGNTLIKGNRIEGWQTSAIMVKADIGSISRVTIDSNYLNNQTGYYRLYVCSASHTQSYVTVTNNVFGMNSLEGVSKKFAVSTCGENVKFVHTEAQRAAAVARGVKGAASWVVWNNNKWTDGTTVVPRGGWIE